GVESSQSLVESIRGHRVAAIVAGLGFGVLLATGLARADLPPFAGFDPGSSDVAGVAALLFERYVWAFELTGVLLIIATLGGTALCRGCAAPVWRGGAPPRRRPPASPAAASPPSR